MPQPKNNFNKPVHDPMKGLIGNQQFEQLLEGLKEMYLMSQPPSPNGEMALYQEGERAMLINLINIYKELKYAK